MTRRSIGDVYELQPHGGLRYFMQHVSNDKSQLGSQVVQVHRGVAAAPSIDLPTALQAETAFFTHVFLKAGEALKVWSKCGNMPVPTALEMPAWRTCPTDEIQQPFASSWLLWNTNHARLSVGPKSKALLAAEIGMVMSPLLVVERAHTGHWSLVYPKVVAS